MIINLANFLLISLIILSFYNFLFLSKNALNNNYAALKINIFMSLIFIISLLIFLLLILAYVISDFSILNVYLNSHPLKPLIYKISGAWGNHEGSMLLWQLILSTYSFSLIFQKNINNQLK